MSQLLYPKTGTRKMMMQEKIILRVVAKALIPFILLFALYVQFHGDFGPGGGFQAGVIFAAGLILYGLIFGPMALAESVKPRWIEIGRSWSGWRSLCRMFRVFLRRSGCA